VKIRPTVIEILTFNKWSSKFYFREACKRQTAIKTGKPLAHWKRVCLQHKSTFGVHYGTGSPGQLGLRVAGFPGHWVTGSLGHKMWPSSMSGLQSGALQTDHATATQSNCNPMRTNRRSRAGIPLCQYLCRYHIHIVTLKHLRFQLIRNKNGKQRRIIKPVFVQTTLKSINRIGINHWWLFQILTTREQFRHLQK